MSNTKTTTSSANSRTKLEALLAAMLAGLENDLPATIKSMVLDALTYTTAQAEQQLQDGLTAFANARAAKAAYAKAVADAKVAETTARAFASALEAWLKLQFGATNVDVLAKYGVTVTPRKKASTASKAVTLAKGQATRNAKKLAAASQATTTSLVVGPNGVQLATPTEPAATVPASQTATK